jgi:hypothetical protein
MLRSPAKPLLRRSREDWVAGKAAAPLPTEDMDTTSLPRPGKEATDAGTHGIRRLERELRERSAMVGGLDPAAVSCLRSAKRDTREAPPHARALRGKGRAGVRYPAGAVGHRRWQWRGGLSLPGKKTAFFRFFFFFFSQLCHISLTGGPSWSEFVSIRDQLGFSVFCQKLGQMWWFFVLKM